MKTYVERHRKEDEECRIIYEMLDRLSPGWNKPYLKSLRTPPDELSKKLEEFMEKIRALP